MSTSAQSDNNSYAVIKTGGKQYTVSRGQRLAVEKLDAEAGQSVTLTDVLAVNLNGSGLKIRPAGASVSAKVVGDIKEKKVIIFKKRRRKGYTKKQGHRQQKTMLVVEDIKA